MSLTPDQRNTMNQLFLQLGSVALTIIGLSFTMSQPLFAKLDTLTTNVTELRTQATANAEKYDAFDRRLTRIETDLYRLQRDTIDAQRKSAGHTP